MVSTVLFLALKKAKAEKFLDVVSYQFATGLCQRQGFKKSSFELLMGQNKNIYLLPTQQKESKCMPLSKN